MPGPEENSESGLGGDVGHHRDGAPAEERTESEEVVPAESEEIAPDESEVIVEDNAGHLKEANFQCWKIQVEFRWSQAGQWAF